MAEAERAIGIVNAGLREHAEECVASEREAGSHGKEHGSEEEAGDFAADAFGDEWSEGAIGGGDKRAGKADAFWLVGVEEGRSGAALQDFGEFPTEIDGVANASVHALAADGAVDVAGIAEQESAAGAEVFGDAMRDAVDGEPVNGGDGERRAGVLRVGGDRRR